LASAGNHRDGSDAVLANFPVLLGLHAPIECGEHRFWRVEQSQSTGHKGLLLQIIVALRVLFQLLVEQPHEGAGNFRIRCQTLTAVAELLIVLQEPREAVGSAPAAMFVRVANVLDEFPPILFARGDLAKKRPHDHHRQHDQCRHHEQLHDEPG
jgi:hypothetical protein